MSHELVQNCEATSQIEGILHQGFEAETARPQQSPLVYVEVEARIKAGNQHYVTKISGQAEEGCHQ